jgi:hypothetical protein
MSEKNHPDDVISFSSIRQFGKASIVLLFEFLGFLKLVLSRHLLVILLITLLGFLLGYGYYLSKPKFYKASMVVQNNELTKKTYAEILDQLNELTRAGSDKSVATALGIQEPTASSLLFVEGRTLDDYRLSDDTSTKLKQSFKVIIGLSKPVNPANFENAILSYVNNSPYLKTLREEQNKIYTEQIAYIDREQLKLDSLKNEYTRFLANGKMATFYNNAFDPANIYRMSNTLVEQKEKLVRSLMIDKNAMALIDGFKPIETPASISLIKALAVFGGALFIFIFAIVFFKELRKKVKTGN